MITLLLSPLTRLLALAGVILAALGAVYTKGRRDADARNALKNYKETQDAIERATRARAAADRRNDAGGLYDNDGYRRD